MKRFEEYNPAVVFAYFMLAAGISMFCTNPVIAATSFSGAFMYYVIRNGHKGIGFHGFCFVLFIIMSLINPLVYHNGRTVLFVFNDNPITLEALIYGANAAGMVVGILYWFRSFSEIMTSDRLLYVFGRISPKFALIFSMTLRYIPLFMRQTAKVNASQKALGLYKDDNIADSVRGGSRVFSVMVTWALENGIITADSMTARGYGTGRRSFFAIYRFGKGDAILLTGMLLLSVLFITFSINGSLTCQFYPDFEMPDAGGFSIAAYVLYAVLCIIPSAVEAGERILWRCLRSEI